MLARLLLVCCAVSIAALPASVVRGRPHKHLAASDFERDQHDIIRIHNELFANGEAMMKRLLMREDYDDFIFYLLPKRLPTRWTALYAKLSAAERAEREATMLKNELKREIGKYEFTPENIKQWASDAFDDGRLKKFQASLCDRAPKKKYGCFTLSGPGS